MSGTFIGTEDPGFSYNNNTICTNGTDPVVTVTGDAGTFAFTLTSGAGPNLSLNTNTGAIDVSASNPGTYNVTYTTNDATCFSDSTVTVTINYTPIVELVANQTVCADANFAAVNFTETNLTVGTTFGWTNDNTNIGLAAAGAGNIAAFTATNATAAQIQSTITVTPTLGTCTGTATTFDLIVDPLDNPGFSYPLYTYCTSETDPTATIDVAGGAFTFVATNGGPNLVINAATGPY